MPLQQCINALEYIGDGGALAQLAAVSDMAFAIASTRPAQQERRKLLPFPIQMYTILSFQMLGSFKAV